MPNHLEEFIKDAMSSSISQLNAIHEQECTIKDIKEACFNNLMSCIRAFKPKKRKGIIKLIKYDGTFLKEAIGETRFNEIALALKVSAKDIS